MCTATPQYLHVPNAIEPEALAELNTAFDRVDAQYREKLGIKPGRSMNLLDYIGLDDAFLELLDLPTTFPKVWCILGWHISLYHSHAISTPPTPPPDVPVPLGEQAGWHQDSGRLNQDLSGDPRPRVSLKVGFFLTDALDESNGFQVIPGSHKHNLSKPDGTTALGDGWAGLDAGERASGAADAAPTSNDAVAVLAKAGDAVLFDRRVSGTTSFSCPCSSSAVCADARAPRAGLAQRRPEEPHGRDEKGHLPGLRIPLAAAPGQHDRRALHAALQPHPSPAPGRELIRHWLHLSRP